MCTGLVNLIWRLNRHLAGVFSISRYPLLAQRAGKSIHLLSKAAGPSSVVSKGRIRRKGPKANQVECRLTTQVLEDSYQLITRVKGTIPAYSNSQVPYVVAEGFTGRSTVP